MTITITVLWFMSWASFVVLLILRGFWMVLLCITLVDKAEKGKANLDNEWFCCLARIYISVLSEFNIWNHPEINNKWL